MGSERIDVSSAPAHDRFARSSHRMPRSLESKIQAANSALMINGDLGAIGECFTPDYAAHPTNQDPTGGHAAVRRVLCLYRRTFPDLTVAVEILVKGKDRVAWRRSLRAIHKGNFRGFPATGRRIVWRDMVTSRFRDGLIAEDWLLTDLAERLLLAHNTRSRA